MSFIREKYDELLRMMKTSDIDNTKLALTIIEENRKKADLPYVMMLYKNKGRASSETWVDHAPKTMKVLANQNYSSYMTILTDIAASDITDKAKIEGAEFVLNQLNAEILNALHNSGYSYIKSIKTECGNYEQ
jgi:hypothetical protein